MTDPHAVAPGDKPVVQPRAEGKPAQRRRTGSTARRRRPTVAWAIYGLMMIAMVAVLIYALT